nr:hypothetical protein CPGR_00963 [Mycolicibacter nonchromogenicus]
MAAMSSAEQYPAARRAESVGLILRTAAQASAPAVNCMTMRGNQLHGL